MAETPKEAAMRAYWGANADVRSIIMAQGQANIQARLQTATALEQRVTQVAALLLAGAAVAAQIAWATKGPAAFLAGVASIAFAVGGAISFRGVKAGDLAMPGADPVWWSTCENIETFDKEAAENWVIGHMTDSIESLGDMVKRRSGAMNLALIYGAIGGGCVAFSAFFAMFNS
jgi:hypothetical protein